MRYLGSLPIVMGLAIVFGSFALAQNDGDKNGDKNNKDGPANAKAQKTYKQALDFVDRHMKGAALESFKKADKQDDGHSVPCQRKMIQYGLELADWKTAEAAAEERLAEAQTPKELALTHYQLGHIFEQEGLDKHKDEVFLRAHDEMGKALAAAPNFPDALFVDGLVLAHLKRDDEAKKQFEQFVRMKPEGDTNRQRALRYLSEPELARERMAPPFAFTTEDGKKVSLDDLRGKVVLVDFWATWCGPCREALPHMREIAKRFQGQPLVVLSVSMDEDEKKWKDFVAKNEMTWTQYREGGFSGPVATLFGVHAIPQTFTIDAEGVLQDQHIGDAAIEGKLKKLVSHTPNTPVVDAVKQ